MIYPDNATYWLTVRVLQTTIPEAPELYAALQDAFENTGFWVRAPKMPGMVLYTVSDDIIQIESATLNALHLLRERDPRMYMAGYTTSKILNDDFSICIPKK